MDLNQYILHNLTINLNGRFYNFGRDICVRFDLCPVSNSVVQFFFDAFFANKKVKMIIFRNAWKNLM